MNVRHLHSPVLATTGHQTRGLSAYFNSVFGREVVETAHVTRNTQAATGTVSQGSAFST